MGEKKDKRLFLLDAFALIYRAYFAFSRNPLINSKGVNVSAISGFTSTLHDLIKRENPTHLAVVFDAPGPTDRAVEHDFYKANREAMPEDIRMSLPIIKEIIKAFHIPMLELPGFEADDVIGTIAKQKEKEGHEVYMVTPDKDFAQLVSDNIFMYKPARGKGDIEILGVKEIKEKWEVEDPLQVIDILGMWGDSVDNIPGFPGVGEKTAKKLIKAYGSMEGVIENLGELKGKLKQNIEENVEKGRISKQLATIVLDAPIEVTDKDLKIDPPDKELLSALFTELEFRTLGKRILGDDYAVNTKQEKQSAAPDLFSDVPTDHDTLEVEKGKNIDNVKHNYQLAQTAEERKKLIEKLSKQKTIAFDTETTGLDALNCEIVGMSFSFREHEAYYVPCPDDFEAAKAIIQEFAVILQDSNITKIGQNIKYDMNVLSRYDLEVKAPIYDTMVAHYLMEPDKKHNMDYLAESFLGYTPVSIEKLIGKKGKNQKSMRDVPLEDITEYASEDADITLQLNNVLRPMEKDKGVVDLLEKLELPLIPVLAAMEQEGVALDVPFLEDFSKELNDGLLKLQEEVFEIAGSEFNLDSPKQLGEVLFVKMEIPYTGKKTKTGQFSTSEDILRTLMAEHPIAEKIVDYRESRKLKSTYVDALPALINPHTGRIHTTFNQTIAATGRLSSIGPNLQNIPIRTERGRRIRKAFIPRDKDHVILSADYSQVELRVIASMSEEANMMDAFKAGEDIHAATAAKVFGVKPDEVTREMRGKAKAVNFGLIYGQGVFGLSQNLGIPRKEAKEIIDSYFEKYPGIRKYMDNNKQFALDHGYVETIMGRRRYLPDIYSKNHTVRSFAERNAINAPIQGSAADLIKKAMIDVQNEFKKQNFKSKMTLQVHDELVFDAHKDELETIKPIVIEKMQNAIKLKVPLVVEAGVGDNWLEAH